MNVFKTFFFKTIFERCNENYEILLTRLVLFIVLVYKKSSLVKKNENVGYVCVFWRSREHSLIKICISKWKSQPCCFEVILFLNNKTL